METKLDETRNQNKTFVLKYVLLGPSVAYIGGALM